MIHRFISSWPLLALATLIGGLPGCATKVSVKEIAVDLPAGSEVNGIPFRVPARFALDVYELKDGQYKPLETTTTVDTLADPFRLYLLQIQGQPLSQGAVTFKLGTDATIDTLKIASTNKVPESLTELGAGLKKVADAEAASKKADATALTNADTALAGSEDRTLAALQAKQEADLAALELDALSATATAVQRKTAEQKVEKTRLLANQKARRAGLPAPFPATADGG